MSLINDALKKAQHQRKDEPAATTGAAGDARIHRRGRATNANTLVLLGSGAIVLIVLSVVLTFYLVNQPSKPAAPVAKVAPAPVPTPSAPAINPTPAPAPTEAAPPAAAPTPVAPTVSVPLAKTPAGQGSTTPLPSATPVVTAATPAVTGPAAPAPAPTSPTPAAAAPASSAAIPDERVASFVESVRVTGIRSFGNESRVLMNERVFRVNDIVDRLLGVKLTAVKADSLVFTDANGVTYVKNF